MCTATNFVHAAAMHGNRSCSQGMLDILAPRDLYACNATIYKKYVRGKGLRSIKTLRQNDKRIAISPRIALIDV